MWGVLKLSNQLPELETQKWTTGGFRVLAPPAGGIGQWVRSNRKVELLNGRDGSAPASITRTQLVPFSACSSTQIQPNIAPTTRERPEGGARQ